MATKVTSSGNVLRSVPQPARFASPEDAIPSNLNSVQIRSKPEPEPLPDLSHLLPWHRVIIEEIVTRNPRMIEKIREAATR